MSFGVNVVECFVEFLDDGHLLVVEDNLVAVHHFEDGLRSQQTQILIRLILAQYLKHPQDYLRIYHLRLERSIMFDVEVDDIQQLVQNALILRIQQ